LCHYAWEWSYLRICDRVAIIDDGVIAKAAGSRDIFLDPKTQRSEEADFGDAVTYRFRRGKYYRITFDGLNSEEPVIANLVLRTKAPVNILYAQTRDIGGTARGQMVIQLPDNEAQAGEILRYLALSQIPHEEVYQYES
jgi:D-methionine transport system ATP-binding protein